MTCLLSEPLVVFLEGKDEPYTLASGYGKWQLLLQGIFHVQVTQSNIDCLDPDDLERISLIVIAGPRRNFSSTEFEALATFRAQGITLLFLLGEGGDKDLPTNINKFLAQSSTGLEFTRDRVMRQSPYKYFHPKQAVIADGLLDGSPISFPGNNLEFVYPFGCTVEVSAVELAVPLLTTGRCCQPAGRPVCAMSRPASGESGKIICFGSLFAFHDQFLDAEDNTRLLSCFMTVCLTGNEELRKNYPRMPVAEKNAGRSARQIISRLPLRPVPVVENVFRTVSLDEHFQRMIRGGGDGDLTSQLRLEMEIEQVAKELNVTWDLSRPLIVTPLVGHLPDLEFPMFDPEPRLPGKPTLPLIDLDEGLVTWEERLERLACEADTEMSTEEFFLETAAALGLSKNSTGNAISATGILQNIVRQILDHDQKIRDRDPSDRQSSRQDSAGGQSTSSAGLGPPTQPHFNLLSSAGFIGTPKILPITDAEILQDCLDRRLRVAEARAALTVPVELPAHEEESQKPSSRPTTARSAVPSTRTSRTRWTPHTVASSLQCNSSNHLANIDVWRPSDSSPISFHSQNTSGNVSSCSARPPPGSSRPSTSYTERRVNFDPYDGK